MAGKSKTKDAEDKPEAKKVTAKAAPKQAVAAKPDAETSQKKTSPGNRVTRSVTKKEKADSVGAPSEREAPVPKKPDEVPPVPRQAPVSKSDEPPRSPGFGPIPITQLLDMAKEKVVGSRLAQARRKHGHVEVKPTPDQFAATLSNPDKLSPKDRAAAGVEHFSDTKTRRSFEYDRQGRIVKLECASGRTSHIDYVGKTEQPVSFSIEHKESGRIILSGEKSDKTDIRVDQRTGDITCSSVETQTVFDQEKVVQREVRVDRHVQADGTRTTVVCDKDGYRLRKDIFFDGKDGEERLVSRWEYNYGQVGDKVDPSAPATAVQTDAQGRKVQEYRFKCPDDLKAHRPTMRADITYRQSDEHLQQLRREYDLAGGTPQLFSNTVKSIRLATGEIAIQCKKYSHDQVVAELNMKFDAIGRPVHLRQIVDSADLDLSFTFKDGKPVSVTNAKTDLDPQAVQALLIQGDLTIQDARLMYEVVTDSRALRVSGPTPPRQGHEPTGTLVWKDANGDYMQATVTRGTIYDRQDNVLGKVQDTGEVSLDVTPARVFNILSDSTASGAFHGVGSDGERLDLCFNQGEKPEERREGFNGVLTNGHEDYSIVGGNLYEESGKFIGHLDGHGRITFDGYGKPPQEAKDINSFLKNGWRFWGNENGLERSFDVTPSMSNGRLFLPAVDRVTGRPVIDENGVRVPPVEYAVRMGMIISQATGGESGKLIPPVESNDRLEGGFIVTDTGGGPLPLAAFPGAVFDVSVIGQSGMPGRRIIGISLGAVRQADGSFVAERGGFLNLQHVLDVHRENAARAASELRSHDDQTRWYSMISAGFAQGEKTSALRSASELAHSKLLQVTEDIENILAAGSVDDSMVKKLAMDAQALRGKHGPPPRYLTSPEITEDNFRKVRGVLRLGNDQYDIYVGELYRVRFEQGKRTPETIPCGKIGPQYTVTFDRKSVNLGEEGQVLLRFHFEGEDVEHRMLSLGPARTTESGARVTGGMVSADELLREATQAETEALKGNLEYFKNMPALLGGSFDTLIINRGQMLINVQQSVAYQRRALSDELGLLFAAGLSAKPTDNNEIDRDVRAVQVFMNEMNLATGVPSAEPDVVNVEVESSPLQEDVKLEQFSPEPVEVTVQATQPPQQSDVRVIEYLPESVDAGLEAPLLTELPEARVEAAEFDLDANRQPSVEPQYDIDAERQVRVEAEEDLDAQEQAKAEAEYDLYEEEQARVEAENDLDAEERTRAEAEFDADERQQSNDVVEFVPLLTQEIRAFVPKPGGFRIDLPYVPGSPVVQAADFAPEAVEPAVDAAPVPQPAVAENIPPSVIRAEDLKTTPDRFAKSSQAGYVDIDTSGRVRSVILPKWGEQRSFEYQVNSDGTRQLSEVTQPDGTVWKSKDGLNWSKEETPGKSVSFAAICEVEADGTLLVKSEDGIRRYRSDGSESVQTPGGGHFLIQNGKLSQVIDKYENKHHLTYDDSGNLVRVEYVAQGGTKTWTRAGLQEWFVGDGASVEKYDGRVLADVDGSITFYDDDGTQRIISADGTVTVRDAGGQVTLQDVAPSSNVAVAPDPVQSATGSGWVDLDEPSYQATNASGPFPTRSMYEFVAQVPSVANEDPQPSPPEPFDDSDSLIDVPIEIARSRLSSLSDQNISSPVDLTSFRYAASMFEERAEQKGLSLEQVARALGYISRLLDWEEGSEYTLLSHPERVHLAQQLMHQLAYPSAIEQGRNDSCSVAAIEVRTATLYPEQYARLIVEIAMTGRFRLAGSGQMIDMTMVRGALSPDSAEALFDRQGVARVHPSQVFQLTAVNIHWQNGVTADSKAQAGSPGSGGNPNAAREDLRYEKLRPGSPSDTGERLMMPNSESPDESPRSPDLAASDLQGIMNEITGRSDRGFTIANEEFVKSWNMWQGAVVPVANPQELRDVLSEAKRAQKLPVIISVHTSHEPFWTDSGGGKAGGAGGWHLVCVSDFKMIPNADGSEKPVIHVDNPWGSPRDVLRTLSPETLYEATTRPKA